MDSAAWFRTWSLVTTEIDCGVSMIGVSVLVAVPLRVATKPVTGPLARSPTTAPGAATAGAACGTRAARLLRAARRLGALRDGCVAAGRARCCGASTVT